MFHNAWFPRDKVLPVRAFPLSGLTSLSQPNPGQDGKEAERGTGEFGLELGRSLIRVTEMRKQK